MDRLLFTCESAIAERVDDDLVIVDSNGNEFKVTDWSAARPRWWQGWSLMTVRKWPLSLNFDSVVENVTRDEFQTRIETYLRKDRRMWESRGPVSELIEKLRKKSSIRGVIEELCKIP